MLRIELSSDNMRFLSEAQYLQLGGERCISSDRQRHNASDKAKGQ